MLPHYVTLVLLLMDQERGTLIFHSQSFFVYQRLSYWCVCIRDTASRRYGDELR